MTINQNKKGSRGELEFVALMNDQIGTTHLIDYSRNPYNQRREKGQSDVVCSDRRWPYEIELKRRKSGPFKEDWYLQAVEAAKPWGKIPVCAYRFDRQQWQVVMSLSHLNQHWSGRCTDFDDLKDDLITMSAATFIKIADELFTSVKRSPERFAPQPCSKCKGSGQVEEEMHDPSGFPFSIDVQVECPECEGAGLC